MIIAVPMTAATVCVFPLWRQNSAVISAPSSMIRDFLTSVYARAFMADPEVNERVLDRGKYVRLKNCGSEARKTSCHPRSTIEGRTYHVIIIDEAQGGQDEIVKKSVFPMGSDTNATIILTGTPAREKNFFYASIQDNKRIALKRGHHRQNHFQIPWTEVAKYSPRYKRYVMKKMLKYGEDSDEFRMSYKLEWLLEQGMFTTSEKFAELEDRTMQSVVHAHHGSPVCVGVDCARKKDRTVVTVVWVRWNHPNSAGYYEHRVLNWLDLEAVEWEEQYFRIKEFLENYRIYKVAVDGGGLGDVVINRLRHLMPHLEFQEMGDSPAEQSVRWKYLKQLMEQKIIKWPGGAKVKTRRSFRRFRQEMEDLQIEYKGPNIKCEAPDDDNAHDDYPDSLAMACILSQDDKEAGDDRVQVYDNMLIQPSRRH